MILRASYPPRIQLTVQQNKISLVLRADTKHYPIPEPDPIDSNYLLDENGTILMNELSVYLTA